MMRSDFVEGAYNKYEHDYLERPDELLQEQISTLAEIRKYSDTGPRREQIDRIMGHIAFELAERLRESREQEIDAAWADYDAKKWLEEYEEAEKEATS